MVRRVRSYAERQGKRGGTKDTSSHAEIRFVAVAFLIIMLTVVIRLVVLQIFSHSFYTTLATSKHELSEKVHSHRGTIYFEDSRSAQLFPVAVNRPYFQVYAVPAQVPSDQVVSTTDRLLGFLSTTTTNERQDIMDRLRKPKSLYQLLERKVTEETATAINQAHLLGIYTTPQELRYYPEGTLGASVLGFCSNNNNDQQTTVGQYGIEGYWNSELAGKNGFVSGEASASGNWITLAGRTIIPAQEGSDLVLTIDRTLQFTACQRLAEGMREYGAPNATLIMMNPKTGAILADCSFPDFDPNQFAKASSTAVFNNLAIFTPYEPGSVFKPFTMAAALDLNLATPQTTFVDPCKRTFGPYTIYNALKKCYGTVTMTQVLQNSINTGVVWLSEQIGLPQFKKYVEKFGFGEKTGIPLSVEASGSIGALGVKSNASAAYASFGQGITATPLQLALGYSAIANGGMLPKPLIVKEIRHTDGTKETIEPQFVEQVISQKTAKILSGMLVATLDSYKKTARLEHYYVAGKTGTAQIATRGGYKVDGNINHTIVGFAPAEDPRVLLVVKYGDMNSSSSYRWAESTTGPVFKDIMKFAMDYYQIPQTR